MLKLPEISWRDLPGYKYAKGLDSAMLSNEGYITPQKVQVNHHEPKKYFNVIYDQEYLMRKVVKMFIKPLSVLGKEGIDNVVNQAWEMYCKQ